MERKFFIIMFSAALVLSGCHNSVDGAYTGANFGYVLGSAIGGITGGWHGHDFGALIGTVSGMATGAAIGASKEKARMKKIDERIGAKSADGSSGSDARWKNAGDSLANQPSQADDRVDFGLTAPGEPPLEIRHAGIFETKRDGVLTRGEECKVKFEIYNNSDAPIFDVRPIVGDVTENKHVKISPNLLVESIGPHKGIRYTATIQAGKKLKNGEIKVMVGVAHHQQEVKSQTRYFTVTTAKEAE